MLNIAEFEKRIFSLQHADFDAAALELFRYQSGANPVYAEYMRLTSIDVEHVDTVAQIPFLPISLFRSRRVLCSAYRGDHYFESSGTMDAEKSKHYYDDTGIYDAAILHGFREQYGDPSNYTILALLPSYLERPHASLVHMARILMQASGRPENGFFSGNTEQFIHTINRSEKAGEQVIVLGVSFALLHWAERFSMPLQHTILMETGGMKGRLPEITRAAMHATLRAAFSISQVHSEYGMTELFSQAFSKQNGIFQPPVHMRIFIRDISDPFTLLAHGESGCINIIDLANVHSCAFIATDDVGRMYPDGTFEVLGRNDNSELRGCNIVYANAL